MSNERRSICWRLYPAPNADEPTRRRRGILVCEALRALGWKVSHDKFDAPIVVLQRIFTPAEIRRLQAEGRTVIADTNDLLAVRGSPFYRPEEQEALAIADYVVVPTCQMCAHYARLNSRCFIIPDALEPEHWTTPKADLPDSPLILCWLGLGDCLQYLEPMLQAIGPVPDLRLRIVTSERDSKKRSNRERVAQWPVPVDFVEWKLKTFASEISRSHAGLVILPDSCFARGKGQHKSVTFMALGLPCLASDMPGYREVIRHGETGLLASSPEEFREGIETLRDPAERKRMGEAGRELSRCFTSGAIGSKWNEMLLAILDHQKSEKRPMPTMGDMSG